MKKPRTGKPEFDTEYLNHGLLKLARVYMTLNHHYLCDHIQEHPEVFRSRSKAYILHELLEPTNYYWLRLFGKANIGLANKVKDPSLDYFLYPRVFNSNVTSGVRIVMPKGTTHDWSRLHKAMKDRPNVYLAGYVTKWNVSFYINIMKLRQLSAGDQLYVSRENVVEKYSFENTLLRSWK